ncbi:MAG: sensor histidine kinase [Thermoanaerobaculia bacterium]
MTTSEGAVPGRIDGFLVGGFALAAFAVALLVLGRATGTVPAVTFATVPAALFGFVALAARYPARAFPLRGSRAILLLAAHFGGAVVAAGIWILALRSWVGSLARLGVVEETGVEIDGGLLALLFGAGMLLYLGAVVAQYLILEVVFANQSRQAALRYEILARESELRALKAQIDPHFLYNSLNAVASLCGSRPEDARKMAQLLADFFRTSLRLGGLGEVSLSDEVGLAETYLAIEKIRFGPRLSLEKSIDPAAADAAVPSLLLQPLIENAVRHGISSMIEGGTIRVSGRIDGDDLVLRVANPADPDRASAPGEGVGIANVRARLAALHSGSSSVRTSEIDGTFGVELRLPRSVVGRGVSR